MSIFGGVTRGDQAAVGETAASFGDYPAAQKAVSTLISGDVPARHIAIVGQGLRSIERVTGRLGYATAARSGAINGLLLGLFFAALLVLGSPEVPIQAFVGVLFVGIAIGMLLSLVSYTVVRRRKDYASVMQVVADHYEVTVAAESIHRARQLLGGSVVPGEAASPTAARAAPPVPRSDGDGEPRYGQRVEAAPDEAGDDDQVPPDPSRDEEESGSRA